MSQECECRVIEVTNKYGFTDHVFEDLPNMPICACCRAFKHTNTGQGTACEKCQHEAELEMQHDYDAGYMIDGPVTDVDPGDADDTNFSLNA